MKNRLKLQNIHEGVSGEIKGKLHPMQEPGTARGGRETKGSRGGERRGWKDQDKRVKKQQCQRRNNHFGIWNWWKQT